MKIRITIATVLIFLAMPGVANAGELSAGSFNSFKGFGISLDYAASKDILNSYMIYADTYRVLSGTCKDAGIKMVYLHYNRLSTYVYPNSSFDLLFGSSRQT